ncbi:hypothetical protein GGF46_005324, partial [Coemansia sp. RSA 552]
MSASVAAGTSLKAHSRQGDAAAVAAAARIDASRSLSTSPDADEQNSVDFENELQQDLENEMSAS